MDSFLGKSYTGLDYYKSLVHSRNSIYFPRSRWSKTVDTEDARTATKEQLYRDSIIYDCNSLDSKQISRKVNEIKRERMRKWLREKHSNERRQNSCHRKLHNISWDELFEKSVAYDDDCEVYNEKQIASAKGKLSKKSEKQKLINQMFQKIQYKPTVGDLLRNMIVLNIVEHKMHEIYDKVVSSVDSPYKDITDEAIHFVLKIFEEMGNPDLSKTRKEKKGNHVLDVVGTLIEKMIAKLSRTPRKVKFTDKDAILTKLVPENMFEAVLKHKLKEYVKNLKITPEDYFKFILNEEKHADNIGHLTSLKSLGKRSLECNRKAFKKERSKYSKGELEVTAEDSHIDLNRTGNNHIDLGNGKAGKNTEYLDHNRNSKNVNAEIKPNNLISNDTLLSNEEINFMNVELTIKVVLDESGTSSSRGCENESDCQNDQPINWNQNAVVGVDLSQSFVEKVFSPQLSDNFSIVDSPSEDSSSHEFLRDDLASSFAKPLIVFANKVHNAFLTNSTDNYPYNSGKNDENATFGPLNYLESNMDEVFNEVDKSSFAYQFYSAVYNINRLENLTELAIMEFHSNEQAYSYRDCSWIKSHYFSDDISYNEQIWQPLIPEQCIYHSL